MTERRKGWADSPSESSDVLLSRMSTGFRTSINRVSANCPIGTRQRHMFRAVLSNSLVPCLGVVFAT